MATATKSNGAVGYNNQYLNNLVYQNGPANWNLMRPGLVTGTITADPGFLRYQADGTVDYHLQSASPATTTGNSVNAPTYDFDFGPRPINGTWSIGAYQYGTTPGPYPQP
ncbi:MAG TPA: choice-of-anchor Q domain-containing protein [Terriglobales bacterium]|nr:choice-of-anchor Q domain-containing protein [Terriglobales bacterium]